MFDWALNEPSEYNRRPKVSFVMLTTRSYLTVSGTALRHTDDDDFLAAAQAVIQLATRISQGPSAGLTIPGFKAYRPYPVQAVWQDTHYQLWLKQPLFITAAVYQTALTQLPLPLPIQFAQMAEGFEIQLATSGTVAPNASVLAQLRDAAQSAGYRLIRPDVHREVYLDGVPVTADKQVLVRLALEPTNTLPRSVVRN